jgi:hypothetical protein
MRKGIKLKAFKRSLVYGFLTAVFYAAVFLNVDLVTKYFTKGSWYAILPITSVFIVSFVHGAFTGNFWTALGIEASSKLLERRDEQLTQQIRKRKRPRPRLYA